MIGAFLSWTLFNLPSQHLSKSSFVRLGTCKSDVPALGAGAAGLPYVTTPTIFSPLYNPNLYITDVGIVWA